VITIATVNLNNFEGLKRTIESVLEQKYQSFQFIIKDGGSTDGSLELLNKYAKVQHNLIVDTSSDTGIYDAMNQCISLASEDYIIFMNSGDVFLDNESLENVVNVINKNKHGDVYYFSCYMDFGGRKFLRKAKKCSYALYGQPAIHQATVFRTSVHKNNFYNLKYKISADYEVMLSIYRQGYKQLSFPEVVLASFEVEENSASYKNQKKSRYEMKLAQKEHGVNSFLILLFNMIRFMKNKAAKLVMQK